MTNERLRGLALGAAALVAVLLSSCSIKGETFLYNGADQMVIIQGGVGDFPVARVKVGPGERGTLGHDHAPPDGYTIVSGGCVYKYHLPIPEHEYWTVSTYSNVYLQLAADFSILLLPDGAKGLYPIAEALKVQRYGYPTRPVSKRCG
jgi:hypothetical protein